MQRSTSEGPIARSFLKPEEFERMPAGQALLLVTGASPLRLRIGGWFKDRPTRERVLPAPEMQPLPLEVRIGAFRTTTRRDARPRQADLFGSAVSSKQADAAQVLQDVEDGSDPPA